MKCQGNFLPCKLNIRRAYYNKFLVQTTNATRTSLFFNIVFPDPTEVRNFMFVKTWIFASQPYPFSLKKDGTKLMLMREVDVYLSPELYNNNKCFLKNINEIGEVAID